MERLIDKDKLIIEYDKAHEGPPGAARKLIEEAETVNAVSYEWIDKYIDWLNSINTEFAIRDARAINAMMVKWEKEHGI